MALTAEQKQKLKNLTPERRKEIVAELAGMTSDEVDSFFSALEEKRKGGAAGGSGDPAKGKKSWIDDLLD